MNFEDRLTTENTSEFEDLKIMQDENPVQKQPPKVNEDFANLQFLHAHKDFLLQPFPRQSDWPALSPAQEFMRKNLCVEINKTVDDNLNDLLQTITGRFMTSSEMIRVKPSYKLVVFLFSGLLYDLCDFEL